MANKGKGQGLNSAGTQSRAAGPRSGRDGGAQTTAPAGVVALGAALLLVSTVASALMVGDHFGAIALPGCGAESPCARAAASQWGSIKLGTFVWPMSFFGTAYFGAALVGWLVARGALPTALRWIARLAALASLVYFGIIASEKLYCPYCLATHIGNLLFWLTMEFTRAAPRPLGAPLGAALAVWVVANLGLGVADAQQRARSREKGESERTSAVEEMIRKSQELQRPAPKTQPTWTPLTSTSAPATTTKPAPSTTAAPVPPSPATTQPGSPLPAGETLAGRYIWGPKEAPIRIVMFTGYQCPDCLKIEAQLEQIMNTRKDVQISIRHFPFCSDCNPSMARTTQPNGCWAARAAEAAGMRQGVDGFWKLHKWLFSKRGEFVSTQELEEGARSVGLDPTGIASTMQSPETLEIVRNDTKLAKELGLFFTPMIFVNGVELKGWHVPDALVRTVEEVAASNPPARGPEADRPPSALEKYVADWRENKPLVLSSDAVKRQIGPADAKVQVVMFGDLQEPSCREADKYIRGLVESLGFVAYTYRHYPFDQQCNNQVSQTKFPNGCRAARLAEAAGFLGGNDAYWKMQAWLVDNPEDLSELVVRAAAAQMGLDGDALLKRMNADEVTKAIQDDISAGQKLPSLRIGMPMGITSIPTIFVNGKHVPRWKLEERPVLDLICVEAAQ